MTLKQQGGYVERSSVRFELNNNNKALETSKGKKKSRSNVSDGGEEPLTKKFEGRPPAKIGKQSDKIKGKAGSNPGAGQCSTAQ